MAKPESPDINADYVRGSLFPTTTPPASILQALVVACKEALQGNVHVYVAPGAEDEDGVRPFWEFRCIFSQDGSLIAHFKAAINITSDRECFLLSTTKLRIPEHDLSEEMYDAYMITVQETTQRLLGGESGLLDGPSTFILANQCPHILAPEQVDWSYSPSQDWQQT